jgi:hypothetical protein
MKLVRRNMKRISLIAVISITFLITGCQSIPNDGLYYDEEINDSIEREDEITRRQVHKKKTKRDIDRTDGAPLNDSVIQEDSILKVQSTKKKKKKKKKLKTKRDHTEAILDDEIERDPIQDFD